MIIKNYDRELSDDIPEYEETNPNWEEDYEQMLKSDLEDLSIGEDL